MTTKTVYIALQQFCEQSSQPLDVLKQAGFNVKLNTLGHRLRSEEMPVVLQGADAVLAGVEPYVNDLFEKLPQLKCISRCGIGTDAIDLESAKNRDIAVLNTVDEVVQPVAELTVSMILALARNLSLHITDFHSGAWKKHVGVQLSEWKIGLVGFGRIGMTVEKLLKPFGSQILVCDPARIPSSMPTGVKLVDFDGLLSQSDLVSLHVSRSAKEGPMFGANEFSKMKKGSFFVNTARGYMVDEKALLSALQSGKVSGAALDVFEEEPYNGPLGKLPNVICTPHIATLTQASRAAMELRAAQNIVSFFQKNKS